VMPVSFCVFFLFVVILSVWKLSFWGQKIIVTFGGILVHLKFMYPSFLLSSDSEATPNLRQLLDRTLSLILLRYFISQI
jgi:hypothetical protein